MGAGRDRERLRGTLLAEGIAVVAEFASIADARRAGLEVDAIVLAPTSASESDPDPLTPRELEVLNLLVEGLSNRAIAARLGISDQTVKFHVAAICGKLGAANRTDAVRRAIRRGIVAI